MPTRSFIVTPEQQQILDEITAAEKLGNHSEVFRFLIKNYKKKSDAPKVSEQKPAIIQMVNDPEVKRDLKKILKLLKVAGRLVNTKAKNAIEKIIEE